ncbi:hypothetical protein AAG906_006985 [Vitis piasezkii]
MLEVVTDENMVIPVLEVNGKTLAKTVSYCSKHAKELNEEDEKVVDLREWDEKCSWPWAWIKQFYMICSGRLII